MNDDQMTAQDADDETSSFGRINSHELRAELDAPNEIDELFQAASDLEHLGLVEDAERIRDSVSALVRQMRRNWLTHSNYIPSGSDQEWVENCNAIPEEVEDHTEFLEGLRAIHRDVENVQKQSNLGCSSVRSMPPACLIPHSLEALAEYFRSDKWLELRAMSFQRDPVCMICGDEPTVVHHRRWPDVLGEEPVSDLTPLCRTCALTLYTRFGFCGDCINQLVDGQTPSAQVRGT